MLQSGQTVGLGTGSTADFFLIALGNALKAGQLRDIRGIPTSVQSERRANEIGIPLLDFAKRPFADITVDGADEISPNLDLIKGLGGGPAAKRSSRKTLTSWSSSRMVRRKCRRWGRKARCRLRSRSSHMNFKSHFSDRLDANRRCVERAMERFTSPTTATSFTIAASRGSIGPRNWNAL